jgi:hypothetical protein
MDRRWFLSFLTMNVLALKTSPLFASATRAKGPVIVSAGRRVDAADAATPRFPSANVNAVRQRIVDFFNQESPIALVCSAACGTDLLALDVAGQKHVKRYVLLGAEPAIFRKESVTDRPGDWGALFDQVMKSAKAQVLKLPPGQEGYLQTNLDLLNRAQALAKKFGTSVQALVIWNEQSRGPDDVTAHFLEQAKLRNIPVSEISTL